MSIMNQTVAILRDLERAISARSKSSIEWIIRDLSYNSPITADLGSRVTSEDLLVQIPDRVVDSYVVGIQAIHREAHIPPWFSESSLKKLRTVANQVGQHGIRRVQAFSLNGEVSEPADVTRETAANVALMLRPVTKAIGSVTGRLEVIDIHGKRNKVNIYDVRTHRGVKCLFPDDKIEEVKAALGKTVIARGIIHRNTKGDAVRVEKTEFEIRDEAHRLPTIDEFIGHDPNFTGDLTTEQYMERLRDG